MISALPPLARAAEFQTAWYFSLLASAILLAVLVGAGYALGGVVRMWQGGEHGPAAVLAGAITAMLLVIAGMYVVGIGGLLSVHGGAGS